MSRLSAFLLLAALGAASHAGQVESNDTANSSGVFGLEVTPGSIAACSAAETVVLAQPLPGGAFEACSFLEAANSVVSGPVAMTAGISVEFGDGFGILQSGSLSVAVDPSLSRLAFVADDTPSGESSYRASFRMRLDDLSLGVDQFGVLNGHSASGEKHFEALVKFDAGSAEYRLRLAAREDDGTIVETGSEEVKLPSGWNLIEIDFLAGFGSGHLLVSLNGVPFGGLTELANFNARIDTIRLGAADGLLETAAGSFDLDEFDSSR